MLFLAQLDLDLMECQDHQYQRLVGEGALDLTYPLPVYRNFLPDPCLEFLTLLPLVQNLLLGFLLIIYLNRKLLLGFILF